ncbi:MAG: class I SAM-dependent methyltransferase [Acidimicrobiia bacterium]|nr:class I SAM-dependent methyltransferase [Acidimicrobiia bacterium]
MSDRQLTGGGEVFADIARKYDRLNRVLSLGRDQAWRRKAIAYLPPGRVLDLGGGTGAANPEFGDREVVALDPAASMLALNPTGYRVAGVGEALPFVDGSFDGVFSAYVFRNLTSVDQTMTEVARVLRSGGVAAIVDLGRPTNSLARAVHRAGSAVVLPTVGLLSGAREEYTYLHKSLDKHPHPEELLANTPLALEDTWRMGPMGFVWAAVLHKP